MKLSSVDVNTVSVCARQRGLPIDHLVDFITEHGATPYVVRLVRAVRRIQDGRPVRGRYMKAGKAWVDWVDALDDRSKMKAAGYP